MRRSPLAGLLLAALPCAGQSAGPALKLDRALGTLPAASAVSLKEPSPPLPLSFAPSLAGPAVRAGRTSVPPAGAAAAASTIEEGTEVYVDLVVNGEKQGEVIVRFGARGALLVEKREFASRGLDPGRAREAAIGATSFVDVASIPGATAAFDVRKLELVLNLPAEAFERRVIDLKPTRRADAVLTRDTSAFANYRVEHYRAGDGAGGLVVGHDVGLRAGSWLLRSEGSHDHRDGHTLYTRYGSQAVLDERESSRRWILGDAAAQSGDLGSTMPLGGLALTKAYELNPYFVPQPLAGFTGTVTTPSELEVYLGNTPVARQRLSPGPFDIRNFSYFGGRRDLRIVVRDSFGREQSVEFPFYFTDRSLAAGLHDYGYYAGRIREAPNERVAQYGDFAAMFHHRYGFTDRFTAGVRGEASAGRGNLGAEAILRSDLWGVASVSASVGRDGDSGRSGGAASVSYLFQLDPWNVRFTARGAGDGYALADPFASALLPRREGSAGFGWTDPRLGTIDVGGDYIEGRDRRSRRTASLTYSKTFGKVNLIATWRRTHGDILAGNEVFFGLFYNPGPDASASLFHTRVGDLSSTALQYSKSVDPGEGLGYRLSVEDTRGAGPASTRVSPYVQYNAPFATVLAEVRQDLQAGREASTQRVAVQGAVTWVAGGFAAFSRPVYDSFAQVAVEPAVEGIRVYQNNREIGRTPASGRLLVPNIGSFTDNVISIEHRDVPIEYSIGTISQAISPPYRSGSLVSFALARISAVSGRLVSTREAGKPEPLTYHEGRLRVGREERAFIVGADGRFYLEDLPAGRYEGTARAAGKSCRFTLEVPASSEPVVELREPIACESVR